MSRDMYHGGSAMDEEPMERLPMVQQQQQPIMPQSSPASSVVTPSSPGLVAPSAFALRSEGEALLAHPERRQEGLKKLLGAAKMYFESSSSAMSLPPSVPSSPTSPGFCHPGNSSSLQQHRMTWPSQSSSAALLHAADIFSVIAEALRSDDEINGALKYFVKASAIIGAHAPNSVAHAEVLENVGDCEFELGAFGKSVEQFRKSCAVVREKFGESSAAVARLHDKLVIALESVHRFEEAEAEAKASLRIKELHVEVAAAAADSNDKTTFSVEFGPIDVAAANCAVGSSLYAQRRLREAKGFFDAGLRVLETLLPQDFGPFGAVMAGSWGGDRNATIADSASTSAETATKGTYPLSDAKTAVDMDAVMFEGCKVLSCLGDCSDSLNDPHKAIYYYKRAVAICEQDSARFPSRLEFHRDACASIAELYRLLGMPNDADVFARRTGCL